MIGGSAPQQQLETLQMGIAELEGKLTSKNAEKPKDGTKVPKELEAEIAKLQGELKQKRKEMSALESAMKQGVDAVKKLQSARRGDIVRRSRLGTVVGRAAARAGKKQCMTVVAIDVIETKLKDANIIILVDDKGEMFKYENPQQVAGEKEVDKDGR